MSQLLPVLLLTVFVIIFGVALLGFAHLIGARAKPNSVKDETYECGLPSDTSGPTKVPIKFYLTAILFLRAMASTPFWRWRFLLASLCLDCSGKSKQKLSIGNRIAQQHGHRRV